MKFFQLVVLLGVTLFAPSAFSQKVHEPLRKSLEGVYANWRMAMVSKNHNAWKAVTAKNRQITIYNRVVSAREPYPDTIYNVPFAPPSLEGLKPVNVNMKGATAIATYFGKIDFGVGGEPSDNLMVMYFVGEDGRWKYDTSDFINLSALPDIRAQLVAGNYKYVAQKDFVASGVPPVSPTQIIDRGYVAKVYAYCPGREVIVEINNGRSKHRFQNDKAAEIIIGGMKDGKNPITIQTKSLPGSNGKEPMDVRVFLMPQVKGNKPVNVYQYRITPEDIKNGKTPSTKSISVVNITPENVRDVVTKQSK